MRRLIHLTVLALLAMGLSAGVSVAQKAYIPNLGDDTVSVIDTTSNTVVASPISVGHGPTSAVVTPHGLKVYVGNYGSTTVSVIDTATNAVSNTITVGAQPFGLAVTPSGNTVYVANFNSNSVSVIDTGSEKVTGTITLPSGPEGVAASPDGNTVYVANGGNVSVIATASNTVTGTITLGSTPYALTMSSDGKTLYGADFGTKVYVISTATNTVTDTITASGEPSGVAVSPNGSETYITEYSSGDVLVVDTASTAVIATISGFSSPVGAAVTPDGTKVYVLNQGNTTVQIIETATNTISNTIPIGGASTSVSSAFIGPPTLTVALAGTGSGKVTSNPSTIDCSASSNACSNKFPDGTQVTLTATASSGSTFAGWSGGACSGTNTCVITPTNDTTITATFNQTPSFLLTVAANGTGSGTVTSSPSGINCGTTCNASYAQGTQVTLSAAPAAGSTFTGWSGTGCSGTGSCKVTMNAAQSVTASFTGISYTLSVAETGGGSGQVTSSDGLINCSATSNQCSSKYGDGASVPLTASASAGSIFSGWSGGGCSGDGTCVVTMSAVESVTATFALTPTNTLSVALTGTGSGTVTSSPSGIDCGSTCSASFAQGTGVTLTAAPAAGSIFSGWSGGGCSGDQGCVVPLGANTMVSASFVPNTAGNLALVAAVLPLSRSVEVGATATAFATMIDAGPDNASTCSITPVTSIPASFVFQTTDPTTNALTGTLNTPTNIAAGQGQSFVIALTPTAPFSSTNVAFTFTCANAPSPAATTTGVDTLNLSGSTSPVPDVVALAASGDPGYVDIPGATGTGVFAVATVNLGIDTTITAAANSGTANLPVTLAICQTNPTSGACMATPAASAATDIPPDATPTFGIFVTGSASVADMPGVNRVFVTFTDSNGVLRGETSVAVRTQ